MNPTSVIADAHIQLFIKALTVMNTGEGKLCTTQSLRCLYEFCLGWIFTLTERKNRWSMVI